MRGRCAQAGGVGSRPPSSSPMLQKLRRPNRQGLEGVGDQKVRLKSGARNEQLERDQTSCKAFREAAHVESSLEKAPVASEGGKSGEGSAVRSEKGPLPCSARGSGRDY